MIRTASKIVAAAFAVSLCAAVHATATESKAQDVTRLFLDGGVTVDQLRVVDVGGILIIRGRAADKAQAEQVGAYAQSLGYNRVANLIQIIEPINDAAVARAAER